MKFLLLFIISVCLSSTVSANEKTTVIIGHVITQTIQNNDMDHSEILENELQAIKDSIISKILFLSIYFVS